MASLLYILRKNDSEETLQKMHDELINYTLFNDFPEQFNYFSLWDESNQSVLGTQDSERIVNIVKEWNSTVCEIPSYCKTILQEIACGKKLTELEETGGFLMKLQEAFSARVNIFTFGQQRLYYDEQNGWLTYLTRDIEKEIFDHPEKYALIQCFYH